MKDTANEFYSHVQPAATLTLEELEATDNKNSVKTRTGEKIYSDEDYVSELYEMYTGNSLDVDVIEEGSIVTATITHMDIDTFTLDVGYKFPLYLLVSRENNHHELFEKYSIGDEIEVYVTDLIKAGRYTTSAYASMSKLESVKTFDKIRTSIDDYDEDNVKHNFFEAKITELIEGGFLVDINGNTAFLPGSLAAPNKITNFESKLGETLKVTPISYSDGKEYMVVSHKEYIKNQIPELIKELDINDTIYTGKVTGTTKFGVFVEFQEYLTGMIHSSELDESTQKAHKNRSLNPGTEIEFRVKEVTKNNRIILSQKEPEENPWNSFSITIPSTARTIVKSVRNYGLFLEFESDPGIVGLLHVSEMGDEHPHDYKEGDRITVEVTKVDPHAEKVYFSLR